LNIPPGILKKKDKEATIGMGVEEKLDALHRLDGKWTHREKRYRRANKRA